MVPISPQCPIYIFRRGIFASMLLKGQWLVLPYLMAKEISGMGISPLGVK